MYVGPSITAPALIAALRDHGICDDARLVSLLGEARHDVSLNQLELALVSANVVSNARLLSLKGALAGLRILDDPDVGVVATLDARLAKATGALVVDREPLTVAMVEDLPANVEHVGRALGRYGFDIWLMTAPQFHELYTAVYKGERSVAATAAGGIFDILDEAVRRRASDIHLSVGDPPTMRVDGRLLKLNHTPIDEEWMRTEIPKLAGTSRLGSFEASFDVDFAYTYGTNRFRVNLGAEKDGMTAALRKIPTKIPTLDELNLPPAIRRFCDLERGLVLVTGPTGSGKSTTLAALLGHIAATQARHLITLEDPIEYYLPSGRSLVHQRELGESFTSFPDGLRQALRQDPDVILVGELRDRDTMKTAITAAETGHLVFGTLHTYDASSTVGRLVSSFPAEEQDQVRAQLAYILKGIVSQTLLPLANSKGRVAAFEVLVSTPAVANNLRKMDGHTQLKQTIETGQRDGMQTMEMALADLVRRGLVRFADAEFRAADVEDFQRRVQAD